ncbi:Adenylate cyclase [Caballeronia sordidicola]|uniref:Adenylate cyclase n=1 Tax=Caballeronia sordidicola TaxID=196367 RepID=A0A2C9XXK2_CABSO|nr:Adenylate cyclase [Caballeronia sordidicola]
MSVGADRCAVLQGQRRVS